MLTAADVEQKTFSTALRGYDLDEVDDFLDEVVATLRDLNEKLDEARNARAMAPPPESESAPAPSVEGETQPSVDESAVGRALIAAQAAADKLLADAENEATRLLARAQEQAESWETEKQERKAEAEAEMAALAARVRSVRSQLAVLAEEVSRKLDDMDAVIVDEGRDGNGDSDAPEESPADGGGVDAGTFTGDSSPNDATSAETETSSDAAGRGTDHLDEILNGVAADLQLDDSETQPPDEDHLMGGGEIFETEDDHEEPGSDQDGDD